MPFPDGLNDYLCKLLWSEEDGEKQSEISTHSSIAVFTSFVGVSPAAGAEQEEEEVLSLPEEMNYLWQKSRFCSPSAEMQREAAVLLGIPFPTVCLPVFLPAQFSVLEREELQLKKDASTPAD